MNSNFLLHILSECERIERNKRANTYIEDFEDFREVGGGEVMKSVSENQDLRREANEKLTIARLQVEY